MPSPFEALVQGLQENRDAQQKKAREVAQQQADKFEREYKVSQAKQQAHYQEETLKNEQENTRIRNFEALQSALKKQADITRDRDKIKISEDALDLKEKIHNNTLDANDFKALQKEILAKQKEYEKSYPPARAQEMAQDLLNIVRQHIVESTAPQGRAAAPQQAQPQGEFGSLGYLNSLSAPGAGAGHPHSVTPPVETPDAQSAMLPAAAAAMALQQQKVKSEQALEEQRKAQAHVLTVTADATKALKTAEATEHSEKAKIAKAQAQQAVQKGEAEIQRIRNQAANPLAHAAAVTQQSKLNEQKFALDKRKAEAELSGSSRSAIDKYARDINAWRKEQVSFQEQIGKTYEAMAKLHVILDPGIMEGMKDTTGQPKYSPVQIQTMRRGAADSMAHQLSMQQSLRIKVDKLQAEIDYTQPLVDKAKGRTVTTSSGAPAHKEQKAHEAATSHDARASERRAAASQRQATAPPKKKIEKKKTLHDTSTEDLWKQLRH